MDDFLKEHGMAAVAVLWFLLVGIAGITGKLLWDRVTRMEKRLDKLDVDMVNLRSNYLDRFECTNKLINDFKIEVMDKLHDLHLLMVESNKPPKQPIKRK